MAWSDPGNVITFRVPKIGDVDVVNLYVHNARRWFGLFESPTDARADYAKNKDVLRVMFSLTAPTQPRPKWQAPGASPRQRIHPTQPWEAGEVAIICVKHATVLKGNGSELRIGNVWPLNPAFNQHLLK